MKLISSRESFARFGKPYGADAIAYAASTSRHDLEPPPDFESHLPPLVLTTRSSPLTALASDSSESPAEVRAAPSGRPSQLPQESVREGESPKDTIHNPVQLLGDRSPSPSLRDAEPSAPVPILPTTSTTPKVQDVHPKSTPASVPPPSAFRASPPPIRPESRASSITSAISYATADEYMYDSAAPGAHPAESPSTP